MKKIVFALLVLFISGSCFSQGESKDSVKVKEKKEQKTAKQKQSHNDFQYDSDDIYTGKDNIENPEIEKETRNTQGEQEENKRHYYRGEIAAETVDLILNVGLIILWLALRY
jgi:hypothetical protein